MRPFILSFQERPAAVSFDHLMLGTKTLTEARENVDDDFDGADMFMKRKTITATRENVDEAPILFIGKEDGA